MARILRAVVAVALISFAAIALPSLPTSADAASGIAYLASTQDGFGGWDGNPVGGSEFTTSEAILAIAEAAQTNSTWSTSDAFNAVDSFNASSGNDPLDYMAAAATSQPIPPGKAAKWIVNVAEPLGLDPTNFLGTGVDLVGLMGVPGPDGSFGTGANFNGAAYAALASYLRNGAVPPQTIGYLLAAQTPAGGWSFDGNPGTDPDTDTTALTLEALIAGGLTADDPAVQAALRYLARDLANGAFGQEGYDNTTGQWWAFGGPSPESTSRALLAITALGYDPATSCWRDTARPDLTGTPYTPPLAALNALQQPDGSWGIAPFNTFTTAQAVQGLEVGTWRPVVLGAARTCESSPLLLPPLLLQPTFTG